jgi:deoxycytidylate deaminase
MEFSQRDIKYFAHAVDAARKSTYDRISIGAVIVKKNTIITTGWNSLKTHPIQQYHNRKRFDNQIFDTVNHYLHAETDAIQQALRMRKVLDGAVIYVSRINRDNKYGMCRPCPACIGAIRAVGIRDIFYTTPDGFAYEQITV